MVLESSSAYDNMCIILLLVRCHDFLFNKGNPVALGLLFFLHFPLSDCRLRINDVVCFVSGLFMACNLWRTLV